MFGLQAQPTRLILCLSLPPLLEHEDSAFVSELLCATEELVCISELEESESVIVADK